MRRRAHDRNVPRAGDRRPRQGGVMKVAVFEAEDWEEAAFARLRPAHELRSSSQPLNKATAAGYADAEVISPFVYSRIDVDVLAQLPALKLIATRSTGYDHIDLAACARRGVVVANVPDYGDSTVAEHVFTLLLALARNLVECVEHTRRGWFTAPAVRGLEIRGKTIAVIGTGRIGRRVIEIAKGFGMNVLAVDRFEDAAAASRLGFSYGTLDDVLQQADVVTLHVPALPETAGLIGERAFSLMKQGSILINTARGNVVDTEAMVRALVDGRLRAAGLDVLPQEPLIREEAELFRGEKALTAPDLKALVANHVLLRFPNVLVTPHNAYNTDAALQRIIDTTIANIEAFVAGRPRNVVTNP
jgi:D-lactate dehydrogenase